MAHLYYRRSKDLSVRVYALTALGLTLHLLATGGFDGNGHLWIFIFPPLLYFLQGIKYGSITGGLIFVIVLAYFYLPVAIREFP
jgi:hypothetical protein